jgi:hypothetical protein
VQEVERYVLRYYKLINSVLNKEELPEQCSISLQERRHLNAGRNHDIKMANRSCENVAKFSYLGTTVSDQNVIS